MAQIMEKIHVGGSNADNLVIIKAPDVEVEDRIREIILPDFERYVHVAADSNHFRWIGASNRMFPWVGKRQLNSLFVERNPIPPRIPYPNRRALLMIFELTNGKYLTILPLSGEKSVSWLEVNKEGKLIVDYGSLGTHPVSADGMVPLLSWYESTNVYDSMAKAWALALKNDQVQSTGSLRVEKDYPEALQYLGWCTWEQYHKNINEALLTNAIDKIETSNIPVRWFLIDDGHQDDEEGFLKSFTPNQVKFPNGWKPIISRKTDDGIKWMGIWHGFLSHWNGVHKDHRMKDLAPHLIKNPTRAKGLLPKDDLESSMVFYDYLVTTVKGQGFDFMKTDNVSRSTLEYKGLRNASKAQRQNVLALEEACLNHSIGLMNCSAQNTIDLLNATNSATMRTSPDYQKHNLSTSKSQILQSVFNVIWLGQTLWPDHDMFHSSDQEVGEAMSVTKAMSGGPIYLSDDPADVNPRIIMPLCYDDGQLIRPEAPAVPLPESIFSDALYETHDVYKTIAPLKNKSCAIVAYNLSLKTGSVLSGTITKKDYTNAPAMVQPFVDSWTVPTDGLVIYDWKKEEGKILQEAGHSFEIKDFGFKLYHLSPIINEWAVIGRSDKYLSPMTVEIREIKEKSITLSLSEMGPVVLYSGNGNLISDAMQFRHLGNNFYKGTPKSGLKGSNVFVIKRS